MRTRVARHSARGEGKLRLREVGSRSLNLFVFLQSQLNHSPRTNEITGDRDLRRRRSQAVQKDALTSRRHTAGGEYLAVPIGRAQERPPPCLASDRGDGPEALVPQGTTVNLGASCPAVAYQQGAADYCVAYGAASAVLHAGDRTTAATIAGVPATALQIGDALGFVRDFVLNSVDGWECRRLKNYDPLIASIDTPVILQVAPHCEL